MFGSSRTHERLAGVDALRGLAALVVLFHHVRTLYPALDAQVESGWPVVHAVLAWVSRRNIEAVLLFFVLSGLSIGLSVERRGVDTRVGALDYYARRLLRIVPLYWMALALSGVVAMQLAPVSAEALSVRTLLGNLVFLQTAPGVAGQWVVPYAANTPLWSLSFEMFFYAGYPWLVRGLDGASARAACVWLLCALGLAWSAWAPNPLAMFLAAAPIWYCGAELARVYREQSPGLGVVWAAVLAACLWVARVGLDAPQLHGLAVGVTCFVLAVRIVTNGQRLPSPGLLVRVGGFSYGLYLLHVPILRAAVALLGQGIVSVCAGIALSLWAANVSEAAARRVMRAALR